MGKLSHLANQVTNLRWTKLWVFGQISSVKIFHPINNTTQPHIYIYIYIHTHTHSYLAFVLLDKRITHHPLFFFPPNPSRMMPNSESISMTWSIDLVSPLYPSTSPPLSHLHHSTTTIEQAVLLSYFCKHSMNGRDIEEYSKRHLGNRSYSISICTVRRKEGKKKIKTSKNIFSQKQ